jgi:hypothetical protein
MQQYKTASQQPKSYFEKWYVPNERERRSFRLLLAVPLKQGGIVTKGPNIAIDPPQASPAIYQES